MINEQSALLSPEEKTALTPEQQYAADLQKVRETDQANYDAIRARVISGLSAFKQTRAPGQLTPSSVSLVQPVLGGPTK